MSPPTFNPGHKKVLDSFLLKIKNVKEGKMFGYPAYFTHGKLFACIMEDGVCIKVPDVLVKKLLEENKAIPFERMGRKMKEWVQLNRNNSDDFLNDRIIFKQSLEYILSIVKKSGNSSS
jgi:hypothetical protein